MQPNQTYAPSINLHKQHYRGALPSVVKPKVSAKIPTAGADDLKVIKGIGPVIEKALNAEGIYQYRQIASFNTNDVNWVNSQLDFSGRIEREEWIEQAKRLTALQNEKNGVVSIADDMKPALLDQPMNGVADDFKRIKGIGLVLEKALLELGIYHYHQLAALTTENAKWVEYHVGFPGRVKRENWVAQSHALAQGMKTEYSSRFDKGETPYKGC